MFDVLELIVSNFTDRVFNTGYNLQEKRAAQAAARLEMKENKVQLISFNQVAYQPEIFELKF